METSSAKTRFKVIGRQRKNMEINLNPVRGANTGASQPAVHKKLVSPTQNNMSFEQTQALERTLKEIPQVRPEKVTQAAALATDASYPTDAQLDRLAELLAPQLGAGES